MMERTRKVGYRLQLPEDTKIQHVFHVSQLKVVMGQHHQVMPLPTLLTLTDELGIAPEDVLDTRYNDAGYLNILIK